MAKDTLRLKLILTADFQTIQSARRIFNDEKSILALRLQDVVENFLTA